MNERYDNDNGYDNEGNVNELVRETAGKVRIRSVANLREDGDLALKRAGMMNLETM